jgi:nucleotide-binding universal stress UspA family protein
VVGFDGSERSADGLAFAVGISRREAASITVVYVTEPWMLSGISPGVACELVNAAETVAVAVEQQAADCLREFNLRWAFVRRVGNVPEELERVAAALRADVIVVGRTARRRSPLHGSVPARLVRCAHRPVIVVA